MPQYYKVPLIASPQTFSVALAGTTYNLTLKYCSSNAGAFEGIISADPDSTLSTIDTNQLDSWILDVSNESNTPILHGIPLIPGIDLFYQYKYLGIGGSLFAHVDGDADMVPDFDTLGSTSNLWFVTYP